MHVFVFLWIVVCKCFIFLYFTPCLSIGRDDDSPLVFDSDALRVDHELMVVKRKPEREFNLEAEKDLTCL